MEWDGKQRGNELWLIPPLRLIVSSSAGFRMALMNSGF